MKTNYEKPEVTVVSFETEEIMARDRVSLEKWGVTTSYATGQKVIGDY